MDPAPLSRRTVLGLGVAAALLAVGGCSQASDRPPPGPTPDDVARVRAISDEDALITAYAAAVRDHPRLATRLATAASEHAEHRALLRAGQPSASPTPPASASASAPASVPPTPSSGPSPSPARSAAAWVGELVALEAAAASTRVQDGQGAAPALARTLASIGAAEAVHAVVLLTPLTAPAAGPAESSPPLAAVSPGASATPSTGAACSGRPDQALPGWQQALAAEHAALWAYGLAGPHLDTSRVAEARTDEAVHRFRRDELTSRVCAMGGSPVASLAAYAVPVDPSSPPTATALLAIVEARVADVLSTVTARSAGAGRTTAARWLADTAVRASRWRGTTVAFPGLPEQSSG